MKLKAYLPLLSDYDAEATLSTEHACSSYGQPVLVLDDGTALGTADAVIAGYRIVEATDEERVALTQAGYHLPDA
ncbi:MAG: hypothetical protein DDT29_02446 [Dehalococcoidia bacterium]|nr:hypothetical protein [Bacillota bacterium]